MKRFILVICIITPAFFSGSCKKSGHASSVIQGDWELRETQASIVPATTFAAGNGNRLVFTATTYQSYASGLLKKSGEYVLVSDTTPECYAVGQQAPLTRIVYDNDYSGNAVYIKLSGNKLSFLSGCFAVDGGSMQTYEKLATQE